MRIWYRLKDSLEDVYYGIKNVIRWAPVIWRDADFDWEYLAHVMEYKLRRMSKNFGANQRHTDWNRQERQTLICAELLHRLRKDEYFRNAEKRYENIGLQVKAAQAQQKYDQEYLGKILGKYLNHWWD